MNKKYRWLLLSIPLVHFIKIIIDFISLSAASSLTSIYREMISPEDMDKGELIEKYNSLSLVFNELNNAIVESLYDQIFIMFYSAFIITMILRYLKNNINLT